MSTHAKQWLAALAAAGIGVLALTVPAIGADPPAESAGARPSRPLALPPGFVAKNINAESGVKTGLVKLTERAVTKNDFNSFLAELAKQDKERAREFKGADQDRLNGIIDQIQKQWKAKYGQDFAISDKNLVFDRQFAIVQGEVSDPAVAINNWPVAPVAGEAVTAANRSNAGNEGKEERAAKLTKDRDVAIVAFPASHKLPEINVSMIHQLPAFWRVDLPNDRTGEQIFNDLAAHLTYMRDHESQWPASTADAYRMVAHHAVAALYGVPVPGSKG